MLQFRHQPTEVHVRLAVCRTSENQMHEAYQEGSQHRNHLKHQQIAMRNHWVLMLTEFLLHIQFRTERKRNQKDQRNNFLVKFSCLFLIWIKVQIIIKLTSLVQNDGIFSHLTNYKDLRIVGILKQQTLALLLPSKIL